MQFARKSRDIAILLAAAFAIAGCAGAGTSSAGGAMAGAQAASPDYGKAVAKAQPVNPFYGVPAYLMRPDGTMTNGLLPINPDDQS